MNIDGLKYTELQQELKKRGLGARGTKPELIARLKNAIEKEQSNVASANTGEINMSDANNSSGSSVLTNTVQINATANENLSEQNHNKLPTITQEEKVEPQIIVKEESPQHHESPQQPSDDVKSPLLINENKISTEVTTNSVKPAIPEETVATNSTTSEKPQTGGSGKRRERDDDLSDHDYNEPANDKSDTDSVILYRDHETNAVRAQLLRHPITCQMCKITRHTITGIRRHFLGKKHRYHAKKAITNNSFQPSVLDQLLHLSKYDGIPYQSDEFHFLYKHLPSVEKEQMLDSCKNVKVEEMEVTLVYSGKRYSKCGNISDIGTLRVDLCEQVLNSPDQQDKLQTLSQDFYWKKITRDSPKKHRFSQQSSSEDDAAITDKDGDAMTEDENDQDQPQHNPPIIQQYNGKPWLVANKLYDEENKTIDEIVQHTVDYCIYQLISSTGNGERFRMKLFFQRQSEIHLSRANEYYCDLCNVILQNENILYQHLDDPVHIRKWTNDNQLPWRKAKAHSLVTGISLENVFGSENYQLFINTLGLYVAARQTRGRGRFVCGLCEEFFKDEYQLEKHLYTKKHKCLSTPENLQNHRKIVLNLTNRLCLPRMFRRAGITSVQEVPANIVRRFRFAPYTIQQLETDVHFELERIRNFEQQQLPSLMSTKRQRSYETISNKNTNNRNNDNIQSLLNIDTSKRFCTNSAIPSLMSLSSQPQPFFSSQQQQPIRAPAFQGNFRQQQPRPLIPPSLMSSNPVRFVSHTMSQQQQHRPIPSLIGNQVMNGTAKLPQQPPPIRPLLSTGYGFVSNNSQQHRTTMPPSLMAVSNSGTMNQNAFSFPQQPASRYNVQPLLSGQNLPQPLFNQSSKPLPSLLNNNLLSTVNQFPNVNLQPRSLMQDFHVRPISQQPAPHLYSQHQQPYRHHLNSGYIRYR
ncbi:unnamed protein product [Didymodactylos carnosus]|uniref:SAP domain-containing protein n=1 Tax=Didymodactylos carnosus TaxID=1234261 RepID=A0A814DD93_9BILA|nr:unnamed protein product [Didymodactylos carnosus]CAF3727139.1 unnamed protein product [Didymodactylos carnosus]